MKQFTVRLRNGEKFGPEMYIWADKVKIELICETQRYCFYLQDTHYPEAMHYIGSASVLDWRVLYENKDIVELERLHDLYVYEEAK